MTLTTEARSSLESYSGIDAPFSSRITTSPENATPSGTQSTNTAAFTRNAVDARTSNRVGRNRTRRTINAGRRSRPDAAPESVARAVNASCDAGDARPSTRGPATTGIVEASGSEPFRADLEYVGFVSAICFLLSGVVLLLVGVVMTLTIDVARVKSLQQSSKSSQTYFGPQKIASALLGPIFLVIGGVMVMGGMAHVHMRQKRQPPSEEPQVPQAAVCFLLCGIVILVSGLVMVIAKHSLQAFMPSKKSQAVMGPVFLIMGTIMVLGGLANIRSTNGKSGERPDPVEELVTAPTGTQAAAGGMELESEEGGNETNASESVGQTRRRRRRVRARNRTVSESDADARDHNQMPVDARPDRPRRHRSRRASRPASNARLPAFRLPPLPGFLRLEPSTVSSATARRRLSSWPRIAARDPPPYSAAPPTPPSDFGLSPETPNLEAPPSYEAVLVENERAAVAPPSVECVAIDASAAAVENAGESLDARILLTNRVLEPLPTYEEAMGNSRSSAV